LRLCFPISVRHLTNRMQRRMTDIQTVSVFMVLFLLHAFRSRTSPFFTRQGIWRIWIGAPVACNVVAASTIRISTLAANRSNFAAFLAVFYRLFTASIRILDRFRELLFHIIDSLWLFAIGCKSDFVKDIELDEEASLRSELSMVFFHFRAWICTFC
jgi:hypothetical protein